ncbi:MAG: nitrous oxide reductase family maturation protein NosD [Candidatus Binatia bacterium]
MPRSTFVVSIAIVVVSIALLGVTPAGAETPVFCNMTITISGQYVLTSDLACGAAPGLEVAANDVHIDFNGHTLSGPGTGVGIITANGGCVGVTGLHLNGGTVTGFDTGIRLCAPASTTMNAHVNGMTVTGNSLSGIHLVNSDGNHVNGNTISENISTQGAVGVRLENSHNNKFNTNRLRDNETVPGVFATCGGFGLFGSNDNVITSNDISDNGAANGGFGVGLFFSSGNTVRGNIVNGNRQQGILVVFGSNHTVQSNTVNQTLIGNGIFVLFASDNTIKSNIAFNNAALDLLDTNANCDNNTWKSNTFGTSNQACIQ